MPPRTSAISSRLQCVLDTGHWLDASAATPTGRCCSACVNSPGCALFRLLENSSCRIDSDDGNDGEASSSSGFVLNVTYWPAATGKPSPAGRRLRQQHRPRSAPAPAHCVPWLPFSAAAMATRCDSRAHPQRFVLAECGVNGGAPSAEVEVAQANGLYPRAECASECLHHPSLPTAVGWAYDAASRCFARVGAEHRCVAALRADATELPRLRRLASHACAAPSRSACKPLAEPPSAALRAAGACHPKHTLRNISVACVGEGGGAYSAHVARAQSHLLWARCATQCMFSPVTPGAAGWAYEPRGRCFRPFDDIGHDAKPHWCLARSAERSRVAPRVASLCAECGEPQRRDGCYARVSRKLAQQRQQRQGQQQRQRRLADASDDGTASHDADDFDRLQAAEAAEGRCRMPCLASLAEQQRGGAGGGAHTGRWTAVDPAWTRLMRHGLADGWSTPAARAAVLGEWRALVRRKLDEGAGRAGSCAGRRAQPRPRRTQAFIELRDAREQMHKNKFVVLDALYIAHTLGRALVEPHVSDSRLGRDRPNPARPSPTAEVEVMATPEASGGDAAAAPPGAAGAASAATAATSATAGGDAGDGGDGDDGGAHRTAAEKEEEAAEEAAEAAAAVAAQAAKAAVSADAFDAARRFAGLGLRHYWDLEPMCARFDLVPRSVLAPYRRSGRVVIQPRTSNRGIGLWRLHSKGAVMKAFAPVLKERVIEIRNMWRSVTNREALKEGGPLPYKGIPAVRPSDWELNPGYELIALQLIGGLMDSPRFMAVQWRSEDWHRNTLKGSASAAGEAPSALARCARWAAERITAAMAARNLSEAFLATDLRAGASGTYVGHGAAQAGALRVLHAAVPRLDNPRLRAFIDAIPDAGVRANVETAICLKGEALLATTGRCHDCGRARRCAKLSSAFGAYLVARRHAYGRPTSPLF